LACEGDEDTTTEEKTQSAQKSISKANEGANADALIAVAIAAFAIITVRRAIAYINTFLDPTVTSMIASAFWIVAIETAEDDSQLAYKPNELGLLCPGTTRQRLASCVQVSPWSQAFLEGFSKGISATWSMVFPREFA
jgi:hypothetical protein